MTPAEIEAVARPKRIQRQRTKGWRMPPNTVYVGRPTMWGNKFTHRDRAQAVAAYEDLWTNRVPYSMVEDCIIKYLRGKNLACWCPLDQPCHADVLLELANGPAYWCDEGRPAVASPNVPRAIV